MNQNSFAGRFHFYFNLAMVLIYAAAGILMIFVFHFESLPQKNTTIVGCVLLLYAAYRTYKLVRDRKESLSENDSSNAAQ